MPAGPTMRGIIVIVIPLVRRVGNWLHRSIQLDPWPKSAKGGAISGCDFLVSRGSTSLDDLRALRVTNQGRGDLLGLSTLHWPSMSWLATRTDLLVWGADPLDQAYCSVGSDNTSGWPPGGVPPGSTGAQADRFPG